MATDFTIPDPSQYLPETQPQPDESLYGMGDASGQDDQSALIISLLAGLKSNPLTPPPKPRGGPDVLGSLGDALASMASVRAGRGLLPIGPYGAAVAARQAAYQKQLMENQRASDILRRQLMIGLVTSGGKQRITQMMTDAANKRSEEANKARIEAAQIAANARLKAAQGKGPRTQLIKNKSGLMEPVDASTGMSLWTGKPVETAAPAGMMGVKQNLDEAERMIDELTTNYQAGPGHVDQATGKFTFGPGDMEKRAAATAAANFTKEGTLGKKLGLGGYAGKYDPHAVVHQRDLDLLPVSLAFPLSMTRRAVEGPMKAIRGALPDYTDPPEVWETFTRQMQDIISIAKTLPWDSDPEGSANQYEAALMRAAAVAGRAKDAAKVATPPASQTGVPRSRINALPESDRKATEDGLHQRGVPILEDQ